MKHPSTPLTPREQEALNHLEQWVNGRDDATPRQTVVEQLTTDGVTSAAAHRLINQLLSTGYLYEHNGIRVTNAE